MRLLFTFLLLASSALAQSSTGGDTSVTSSTSGTTASVLGSRAWAPGPLYPIMPIAVPDVTPLNTSGYTVLADTTSYADLVSKITTAAAGCDSGHTGYIINIPQGSAYTSTNLILPATTCTTDWIVIQTKGLSWTRDTRIDPSTQVGTLAKITATASASGVISTPSDTPNVSHYWLLGLEVEQRTASGNPVGINIGTAPISVPANLPHDIFGDHLYVHGRAQNNVTHCVVFGGNNIALVDSWISDCHDIGSDNQAIAGYAGGTWLAQNNFLEAAGMSILFGGSNSGGVNLIYGINPHDYTERKNWIYRPDQWRGGSTQFAGVNAAPFHWDVKNMHEYKMCVRCLVENEIFQNFWAANQVGQNLLSNQAATQDGYYSLESDHTFRYLHVIGGVGSFEGQGKDGLVSDPVNCHLVCNSQGDTPRSFRVMFQNILVEGMSLSNCDPIATTCGLTIPMLAFGTQMNGVIVDHFTSTSALGVNSSVAQFAGTSSNDTSNTYLSNSIMTLGTFGFHTSGGGSNIPADAIKYWGGGQAPGFYSNVFADSAHSSGFNCTTWNAATSGTFVNNQCPTDMTTVGFVNWNSGSGGDYRLTPGSTYSATGTHPCPTNPDGTGALIDCGADVTGILAATAGLNTVPSLWPDSLSGGSITLTPSSLTCNNSNTVVITPNAGTNGGSLFVQSGLDVTFHAAVVTPGASSTTSITITPPTYAGAFTITNDALTTNLATYTTSATHGLHPGDFVTITGLSNGSFYNVTSQPIKSVTTNTFVVPITHANVTSAADSGTGTSTLPVAVSNMGLPLVSQLQCN